MKILDLFGNGLRCMILLATCEFCLSAAANSYPKDIPDDDRVREKFDEWATEFGFHDEEEIFEEAFLLNCSPDSIDEKRALFRISRIELDEDGNPVVWVYDPETKEEVGNGQEYGNGYIRIVEFSLGGADKRNAGFFKAQLTVLPSDW